MRGDKKGIQRLKVIELYQNQNVTFLFGIKKHPSFF